MKLSEYKNGDAIDLLAEILEPASKIIADPAIKKAIENKNDKLKVIKIILKNHKESIIEIMAALNGKEPEEFECNVFTLPIMLIDLFNDKELVEFFTSQAQMNIGQSSGPATEIIEETETK